MSKELPLFSKIEWKKLVTAKGKPLLEEVLSAPW